MPNADDSADPFDSLAADLDDRELPDEAAIDALFTAPDVESVDSASLWAALANDSRPKPLSEDVLEIDKTEYCDRCPHLESPPTVACTHPEATILGFPDRNHVRVQGCPYARDQRPPTRSGFNGPTTNSPDR